MSSYDINNMFALSRDISEPVENHIQEDTQSHLTLDDINIILEHELLGDTESVKAMQTSSNSSTSSDISPDKRYNSTQVWDTWEGQETQHCMETQQVYETRPLEDWSFVLGYGFQGVGDHNVGQSTFPVCEMGRNKDMDGNTQPIGQTRDSLDINNEETSYFAEGDQPGCSTGFSVQFLGSASSEQFLTEQDLKHLKEVKDQSIPVSDGTAQKMCKVCTASSMKYSSYGGNVCSSCRSFFRRSVQTGYHSIYICRASKKCRMDPENRRKCQFCRFQCCLRAGMMINWVLSEQERSRRFNKLKKVTNMETKQEIPSFICLAFSLEEEKTMQDLRLKFKVPWLQNFLKFDREAGFNFVEHAFGCSSLKLKSWETFKWEMSNSFIYQILPRFPEMTDLSSHDIGQIMNSPASGIAKLFRNSHAYHMAENSHVAEHVVRMSKDTDTVTSLDLSGLMSRLDLTKNVSHTNMPAYEELYPDRLEGEKQDQEKYRDSLNMILNWPKDEHGKFDFLMVVLMTLILAFNADFYTLVNRDSVEKVQMKYIMLLQRYLRSKRAPEAANTKFLNAMLLIAQARQAWEISSGNIHT